MRHSQIAPLKKPPGRVLFTVVTAIALFTSLHAVPADASPVCYQLPFSNPDVSVYPWGAPYDDGSGGHHRGTDFPQARGTPIPAAADGVVAINEYVAGGTGNAVVIAHADGMFSGYSHMLAPSPYGIGSRVSKGQILGHVGLTGWTSGYHLHLTMTVTARNYNSGNWATTSVNPVNYIAANSTCCTPSAEVCDGQDNDCDGAVDEDEICEQTRLFNLTTLYAPPTTTDINGDGKADLCGRGTAGFMCHLADGTGGLGPEKLLLALSNANGWADPFNYATMRMGDIDGDGKADLCARHDQGIACWTSKNSPLSTVIEGPKWSDASGWNQTRFASTIRLLDFDGDGREDICGRNSEGIVCHRSIEGGFGAEIVGPRWADRIGFTFAKYYSTLRTGDVNGDGKDDLCVRGGLGMVCTLSTGTGFAPAFDGPQWSDAAGWGSFPYYNSIQLADVNGDSKADLCARSAANLMCHLSTGQGFGPQIVVAPLSDAFGWADPANFLTLRTGDIDGDGAADLCVRADLGVRCYSMKQNTFQTIAGPGWSDAAGFGAASYYETIRMGDIDGDGRFEMCARGGLGWACAASTGSGFADTKGHGAFTDSQNWSASPYYNTIFFGSPVRIPLKSTPDAGVDRDAGSMESLGAVAAPNPDSAPQVPSSELRTGCSSIAPASSSLLSLVLLKVARRRPRASQNSQ
jgi:Peptidase family M23/FG-GAP-like repeat